MKDICLNTVPVFSVQKLLGSKEEAKMDGTTTASFPSQFYTATPPLACGSYDWHSNLHFLSLAEAVSKATILASQHGCLQHFDPYDNNVDSSHVKDDMEVFGRGARSGGHLVITIRLME